MQRYILIRFGQAIITLLMLSIAVFLSSHLTGDPAAGESLVADNYYGMVIVW